MITVPTTAIALTEEQHKQLRSVVDATFVAYMDELPARLKTKLDNGVWTMLGWGDKWSDNNLREDSVLGGMLKQAVYGLADKFIPTAVTKALKKLTAKRREKFAVALDHAFDNQMGWKLKQAAETVAKSWADRLVKGVQDDLNRLTFGEALVKPNADLNDETQWQTGIAQKVLEGILADFEKRMKNPRY
jgi:hypothetical protein